MKIKRLIKTMAVFFVGNALSKLISFFLLPLYTSKISPVQYGNYDIALSFVNLIAPLAFFQIWDGMYRLAFDYKEENEKNIVISNAIGFSSIGIILYLAMFFVINLIFDIYYFEYVLLYGFIYGIHYLFAFSTRVYLSNKLFVFSGLISTLTTAILNIILILGFGWDIKSIYFSAIIGLLVQIVIIEVKIGIIRHFRIKYIQKTLIRKMVRFSIPLCISTISYWLLSGFTKVLIQAFVGDYGNGIYAVANKFSTFITFIVTIIQYAWNETAYLISTEETTERTKNYELSMNIMIVGVVFGTACFCLIAKILFPFMVDEQYSESLFIIPISIIGTAANSLASFIGTFFLAEKRTKCIWISTMVSASINVVCGYICVKYLGLIGGIAVLSISFILLALIRMITAMKMFKLKLDIKKTIYCLAILVLSLVIYYSLDNVFITVGGLILITAVLLFLFRKSIKAVLGLIKR